MFNNPAARGRQSNFTDFAAKLPRSKNRSFYKPEENLSEPETYRNSFRRSTGKNKVFILSFVLPAAPRQRQTVRWLYVEHPILSKLFL